ncbi:MAG: SpoIIE family protein phosphatase [Phycisphaeraceae bacterium]|nr:SpoIIE family protein phosphatase [Phycisphaeraceae bacterium]
MRILIAEDERITRASLVRQLESWGHTVAAAEDGEQAWERFSADDREDVVDVVITDWEMPRLSGLELIRRIRARAGARFVYIIMLTGRTDKADVVSGIEAGADDFVAKPFDRDELRVRLLAGERMVRLERTLSLQNDQLRQAGERMRYDLEAASRVQRAMLPRDDVTTPAVRTAWRYVPTDALAGDAVGLHLVADRYLVAYVADVSGHGVPAALLSVTAMHALVPVPEETSLLRDLSGQGPFGTVRCPGLVATEMNRRFRAGDSDGRYLTMILCMLDTYTGRLRYTSAGHPPPVVLRAGSAIPIPDAGGVPIAILDDERYDDAGVDLRPGDRICLFSDGLLEQDGPQRGQFGNARLISLLASLRGCEPHEAVDRVVAGLAEWAGGPAFTDDVSIVAIDWMGPPS